MAVCAALAGCVVPPSPRDTYTPPDSSATDELATLHVYRPKAFFSGLKGVHIHIDDKKAARIGNGGAVTLSVAAGKHTIEAFAWNSPANAPVMSYGRIGGPIDREFLAGETHYLRFKFGLYPPHERLEFTTEAMYKNTQ